MRRAVVLLSLLSVGACMKKSGPRDAMAPEATAAPGGDFAMDDGYAPEAEGRALGYTSEEPGFDELQARFEQLDADLSAQGISGAEEAAMTVGETSESSPKVATKKDIASRCERICSLKDAICDVSARICGLAETHEDDTKYLEACTRSESRCEQATTACSTCTE